MTKHRYLRHVRALYALVALALCAAGVSRASTVLPTLPAPVLFAPGIVSGSADDGSPAISPDGTTMLFTRSSRWGIILESHRTNGAWSRPQIASFSGTWNTWAPEFSPDGTYVIFVQARDHAANLWRVNRTPNGWSEAQRLPDTVNIGTSIWKSSIAADGSIYLTAIDASGGKRLYCSRYRNGAYETAQPLPFSDGKHGDVDPAVAPDQSFVVFASNGRTDGDPNDRLFIAFRANGEWGSPVPVRYDGDGAGNDNEPRLSRDLSTLYFSSDRIAAAHFPRTAAQAQRDLDDLESWNNGTQNAWTLPLAPLLKRP
jgi:Tol biopolymer transport system component